MQCYVHPEVKAVGACVACGKGVCEECAVMVGQKYYCRACAASGAALRPTTTNGLAITSLVLGIVSVPLAFCYGFGILFAIPALILGLIARRQIEESGGMQSGKGLALAGMITGGIVVGVAVLAVISIVVLVLLGPAVGNVFSNIVMEI
jgi:hypothetical protein